MERFLRMNICDCCSFVSAWYHLVSDVENAKVQTPVKINQDANFFVIDLSMPNKTSLDIFTRLLSDANESASFTIESDRQGYLIALEGNAEFSTTESGYYFLGCGIRSVTYFASEKQVLAQLENHDAAEIKVC